MHASPQTTASPQIGTTTIQVLRKAVADERRNAKEMARLFGPKHPLTQRAQADARDASEQCRDWVRSH